MNGNGSKPRPTDLKRYGAGWDRVFGNIKLLDDFSSKIINNQRDLDDELRGLIDSHFWDMLDPDLANPKHRDATVTYKGVWRDLAKPDKNE